MKFVRIDQILHKNNNILHQVDNTLEIKNKIKIPKYNEKEVILNEDIQELAHKTELNNMEGIICYTEFIKYQLKKINLISPL